MSRPAISLACSLYDRMLPLYIGEVSVEGFDLKFTGAHGVSGVRAIFDKVGAGQAYDVAEMSSSEYVSAIATGNCPYVAIPVFPSRAFRSGYVFVRSDRIGTPRDLEGKKIGIPLFTMTAAVFARGYLSDEHDVDFKDCTWIQGAMNQPGTHGNPSAPALARPVRIEKNNTEMSISDLLDAGAIDATVTPVIPDAYGKSPSVQRLFPEYRKLELDYYKRTGVFPIMHLIVIRREVHERHPDLAQALYDAFNRSKKIALDRMKDLASLEYMLPWLAHDVEEIEAVFDGDPWRYGVEPNRPTLTALTRYLYEQGLTADQVPIERLFVPVEDRN